MTSQAGTMPRHYRFCIVTLVIAGVCAHALHHRLYSRSLQPLAVTLRKFPEQMGPWHVQQEGLEGNLEDLLKLQDYWAGSYADGRGGAASLFIGYYADESVAKYHEPTLCYPSAGWTLLGTDRYRFELGRNPGAFIEMNRLQVQRGGQSQMVLYWYQLPDSTVTDLMMSKVRRLRRVFQGRFSRSLVKVQIAVPMTDSADVAMERLRPFIGLVLKSLAGHLGPGWAVPQADIVEEGGS